MKFPMKFRNNTIFISSSQSYSKYRKQIKIRNTSFNFILKIYTKFGLYTKIQATTL